MPLNSSTDLLATVEDFAVALQEDVDPASATYRLAVATSLVRKEARQDFLDANGDPDAPAEVQGIVIEAAIRGYVNPKSQRSLTVGGFSEVSGAIPSSGPVMLTEDERRILRRYRPSSSSGLWSMKTTRWNADTETVFIATDAPGADPIPMFMAEDGTAW